MLLKICLPSSFKIKFIVFAVFIIGLLSVADANEYDCEVIQYKVSCTIDKNKNTQETTYYYQINNRAGDEHAKITVPYSKKNKVSIVDAWIEDASGAIVKKLKNSEITDQSAISDISFYQDQYIKKFDLRYNSYPYRIHYKTRYVETEVMEIIDWIPVIDTEIPTKYAELSIEVPRNYPIKIYEEQTHCTQTETPETNIYEWKYTDLKVLKDESLSPPHSDFLPRVIVLPENFSWFTKGSFLSWTSFGDWYCNIIDGLDEVPESEKIQTNPLVKGITDKREIVKKLYHYLQDRTRYISISIKYGGLRPYPAAYVSQNKYGDCKALSNYFIALLKLYNIPAYYTVIYADENPPKFIDTFPSHQFNHIIVTVPLDNDTLFLETTSNIAPFDYLGEFTQNRKAFLIERNNSRLIHIPALSVSEQAQHRRSIYNIDITGNCAAELNLCFRGSSSEMYNSLGNLYTKDQQERILREYILNFSAFEIENWELKKENRDSAKIVLNVKLRLLNFLQDYGNKKAFSIASIYLPELESPEKRTLPVRIITPYVLNDTVQYNLSRASECSGLPNNVSIQSAYGSYARTVKKLENQIEIYRSIIIYAGNYSLKDYPEFYAFIQNIKNNDRKKILIPAN